MMEPDIRQRTNAEGFCATHYHMMFERKNRLGLALILESHLEEVRKGQAGSLLSTLRAPGARRRKKTKCAGKQLLRMQSNRSSL